MTNLKKAIQTNLQKMNGLKGQKCLKVFSLSIPLAYFCLRQNQTNNQNKNVTKKPNKFRLFLNNHLYPKNVKNLTQEQWMHYKDYGVFNLRR